MSSLYWINIEALSRKLLSNSLCSEAPHSVPFSWKDLGLPGASCCSEHFQGSPHLQPARELGQHLLPLTSSSSCHPIYSHLSLVSSSQVLCWRQAGTWQLLLPWAPAAWDLLHGTTFCLSSQGILQTDSLLIWTIRSPSPTVCWKNAPLRNSGPTLSSASPRYCSCVLWLPRKVWVCPAPG